MLNVTQVCKANNKWKRERCIQTLTNNMVNSILTLHDDTLKRLQENTKKLKWRVIDPLIFHSAILKEIDKEIVKTAAVKSKGG